MFYNKSYMLIVLIKFVDHSGGGGIPVYLPPPHTSLYIVKRYSPIPSCSYLVCGKCVPVQLGRGRGYIVNPPPYSPPYQKPMIIYIRDHKRAAVFRLFFNHFSEDLHW